MRQRFGDVLFIAMNLTALIILIVMLFTIPVVVVRAGPLCWSLLSMDDNPNCGLFMMVGPSWIAAVPALCLGLSLTSLAAVRPFKRL